MVSFSLSRWSIGAMVLGKLSGPGRPTNLDIIVGQGPITLAVGAGGGWTFFFSSIISLFFLPFSTGDGPI